MQTLNEKIKELEAKHKEQLKTNKAKLVAKYKAKQQQEKQTQEKAFLAKINKYRRLINNDDILFGSIISALELIEAKNEAKINQLIELTRFPTK